MYAKNSNAINLRIKLPYGLSCSHCVMQWKYRAGNSWGAEKEDKGFGKGAPQEEFYNCADIRIGSVEISNSEEEEKDPHNIEQEEQLENFLNQNFAPAGIVSMINIETTEAVPTFVEVNESVEAKER